ncbi:hypothetical protein EVA_03854 [gut metagenome]|uniref:Uncharacterized protein n=1 Tax=gut metagenome TaxID=749906 RepID=J9H378_9ZZZZ
MGRGMPRPYNFFAPISKCNLFGAIVTPAMGRSMPRPYNFFVPISKCNLFGAVVTSAMGRSCCTVAACHDPLVIVTYSVP